MKIKNFPFEKYQGTGNDFIMTSISRNSLNVCAIADLELEQMV